MEFNKFKQLLETSGFTAENDYSNSTDMQTIVKKKDSERVVCVISEEVRYLLTYTPYANSALFRAEHFEVYEWIYRYTQTILTERNIPKKFLLVLNINEVFSQWLYLKKMLPGNDFPYSLVRADDVRTDDAFMFTEEDYACATRIIGNDIMKFERENPKNLHY